MRSSDQHPSRLTGKPPLLSVYKVATAPDGNITLLSVGGGQSGPPAGQCLSSLTGGIGSKIEFQPCASAKNRENLWHLSADGLLHNRAIQVTQGPSTKETIYPARSALHVVSSVGLTAAKSSGQSDADHLELSDLPPSSSPVPPPVLHSCWPVFLSGNTDSSAISSAERTPVD